MQFWWLAWKDLLLIIRDKKAFLTLIIMPLLLIAILGSAFGNMMKEEGEIKVNKFTLGITNLDQGALGNTLINQVFRENLSDQVEVKEFPQDTLFTKVRNHELAVGLVIEPNFTTALLTGKETKVQLISIPDPGVKAALIQGVIEQFAQTIPIEVMAVNNGQQFTSSPGKTTLGYNNKPYLIETTIDAKAKPVSSFQYYAAAMGVMFLLMTVVQGVSAMVLEKGQEVYKRLLISNLTYTHYLLGKIVGLVMISLLQATVIILGTKWIFGVEWGESISGISFMTFAFVLNACGLGVFVGSFLKTEKAFSVAGMFGTQIMAALGGSMVPIYIFPDWVVTVTKLLPNGLALQSYLNLMSGASFWSILPAIGGSIALAGIFFGLSIYRLSKERSWNYA